MFVAEKSPFYNVRTKVSPPSTSDRMVAVSSCSTKGVYVPILVALLLLRKRTLHPTK